MKVVVVGAGFAGLASAFAARCAGAEVTLVHGAAGSSELYAGALDGQALPALEHGALTELCERLGLRLAEPSRPFVLATREGVIRRSFGADSALLELSPLAGGRVGVICSARDDWDGELLTRSFADSTWARKSGTRFEALPVELVERGHERRIAPFDFARKFDDPARVERLLGLLRKLPAHDGFLFGPWLGIERAVAAELGAALGVAIGETTSPLAGPAGGRFELRRRALLDELGIREIRGRVAAVAEAHDSVSVRLQDGGELAADAVILALGGVAAGGVLLHGALSGAARSGFEFSVGGLPAVQAFGEAGRVISSMFGVDFAVHGLPVLESVGLAASELGLVPGTLRVYAAGDLLAPAPPSVLAALQSGLLAGHAASGRRE